MVAPVSDDIHRPRGLRHNETIHSDDGQDEKENDGHELLTKKIERVIAMLSPFLLCVSRFGAFLVHFFRYKKIS